MNYAEAVFNYLGSSDAVNSEFTMSACEAINKIRNRADVQMPDFPDNLSSDEFIKKYRRERMVELAFEGHRFGIFVVGKMVILRKSDRNANHKEWGYLCL